MTQIALAAIERDLTIQCRASLDTETVNEYAAAMYEGATFPPVVLFGAKGRHWIGDGWHRVGAAESAGLDSIDAEVHPGGRLAALKHALGANAAHGHRRTNADKRRAVEIALREFPNLSSRAIATLCAVDDRTVRSFVDQVRDSRTSTVTGADGKQYPAKRPSATVPDAAESLQKLRLLVADRALLEGHIATAKTNPSAASDIEWHGIARKVRELMVASLVPPEYPPPEGLLSELVAYWQPVRKFLDQHLGEIAHEHQRTNH